MVNQYSEISKGITAHIPRSFLLSLSNSNPVVIKILYSWIQLLHISEFTVILFYNAILSHTCIPNIDSSKEDRVLVIKITWNVASEILRTSALLGTDVEGRRI